MCGRKMEVKPPMSKPMKENDMKVYLGDSVYAKFEGYGIVLTTENGLPE